MNIGSFVYISVQAILLTVLMLAIISISGAQVRSSGNYQLESDSINFGGGLSTSSNYELESTAGEIATGESNSSTYQLRAGYQQMQEVYISISDANSVVMDEIGGLTGGTSNGTTSVVVTTDSPSGYSLTIKAESSPAMQKGSDTIPDYNPLASPDPDMSFLMSATNTHFGFSPSGDDIVDRFRDNGSFCNLGSNNTLYTCWDGLSTSEIGIAEGSANHPSGATTTIHFRMSVGSESPLIAGDYIATTTLTALPL